MTLTLTLTLALALTLTLTLALSLAVILSHLAVDDGRDGEGDAVDREGEVALPPGPG